MISQKQVEHIAQLARLGLADKEIKKMRKELAAILDFINLLKKVDVSSIKENFSVSNLENVMRKDTAEPENEQINKAMLEQAPQKQGNYIKVKQILS